jgi:hypothetical protein
MVDVTKPARAPKKTMIIPVAKKGGRPTKLSIAEKEEKAIVDEQKAIAKAAAPKNKGGRKRNENFLPWDEAREYIQSELLHSRAAFEHWFNREKPKSIPRFPYRVYVKEWVSWNDFLGTNNEFNVRANIKWRSLNDSTLFVHALKLKTQRDWLDYCKSHADEVPEDIPRRPDVVYDKWVSWNHWLGNKPVEAMQAKVEASKTAVFYIIHEEGVPFNVLTYGVEQRGIAAMKERFERSPFDMIGMFWYEPDQGMLIKHVVDTQSTPYLDDEKQRITSNVWEIVEQLQTIMMTVR